MTHVRTRIRSARDILGRDAMLRRVLKNTGWLTGANGAILVLSTLQGVLTARLLGVTTWGVLGIALSFAAVVGRLLSFRMNDFVVKWVTQLKVQDERLAPTAFKIALVVDVATAIVAFAFVELAAGWGAETLAKSPELAWVFRIVALYALLQAGRESFLGMLHVNGDFRVQSLVQGFGQAVSVGGILLVLLVGGGLAGVTAAIVASELFTFVLLSFHGLRAARSILGPAWVSVPLEDPGRLGREMAHFAIMVNISGTLRSTMNDGDLLILGYFAGPTAAAYYKLARSITQVAQLPNLPMVNAFYPQFSAAAAHEDWAVFRRLIRRGSAVATVWALPVSLGLFALSPLAVRLLYGPSFLPAVPALGLLLIGLCCDLMLFWTSASLLSLGQPGYHTSVNLAVTGLKLAAALVVVPAGGYLALAALQSIAAVAMNLTIARRVLSSIRTREDAAGRGVDAVILGRELDPT